VAQWKKHHNNPTDEEIGTTNGSDHIQSNRLSREALTSKLPSSFGLNPPGIFSPTTETLQH